MNNSNNSAIWDNEHFAFTTDFQKQILVTILQNKGVFDRLGHYIDYRYFENKDFSRIYKNILDFNDKYKAFPDVNNLSEHISLKTGLSDELQETIQEIYESKRISKENVDFVESTLSDFIQSQALKKAIIESLDDLGDSDKHSNIKNRIEEALSIATKIEDLGVDAYSKDSISSRIRSRQNNDDTKRLSFKWESMDNTFGGLGVKELFSFIGPAHSGKSMFLINTGVNLLLQGYNVLHITLEMSEEITIQRYDMSLLGLTKQELRTKLLVDSLKDKLKNKIGKVWVKQFPSDTLTATELTTFINRLASAKGFVPDVLIVDYADIMCPTSKYHEKRHELGSIYKSLRNVGVEFNIPVVTATQMNRSSLSKLESGKILDEQDIAEAYNIMQILDAAVSINSTVEDRNNNRALLYAMKNRDGDIGTKIKFYIDWTKAYAKEWETIK